MRKETEPKTKPERVHPVVRSPFEFIRGLFKKSESAQIGKIEILCDRLPEGPIMDPRRGYRILKEGSTTEIVHEQDGVGNPCGSRLRIEFDDHHKLGKIGHTEYFDDGTGTIPPIERVFDPGNPEGSNLPLETVVESLEEAHKRAPRIVRG